MRTETMSLKLDLFIPKWRQPEIREYDSKYKREHRQREFSYMGVVQECRKCGKRGYALLTRVYYNNKRSGKAQYSVIHTKTVNGKRVYLGHCYLGLVPL